MLAVCRPIHVSWCDLWDFERPKPNERSQSENQIVSFTPGVPAKVLDFGIGHPNFVKIVPLGGFYPHDELWPQDRINVDVTRSEMGFYP